MKNERSNERSISEKNCSGIDQGVICQPNIIIINELDKELSYILDAANQHGKVLYVTKKEPVNLKHHISSALDILIIHSRPSQLILDTIRDIRNDVHINQVSVIFISDNTNGNYTKKVIRSGADYFIQSPIDSDYLDSLLGTLVKNRKILIAHVGAHRENNIAMLKDNESSSNFLDSLDCYIQKEIDNPDLKYDKIATQLGICKTLLFVKLKKLTGRSPGEYIRKRRVEYAAKLMLLKDYSVSQAGYSSGFNSLSCFSRAFKEFYNTTPKKYIKNNLSD